jgi:crotonobetainyl-CoA:carnitine CoA-transferase CaiB-like acyl-CoA transferase
MSGFLSPYRVLDLSDERGLLAGHMLAQLGADVIQVEPPRGSPARAVGPFADDAPQGENSLYWSAYAAGKRGLACDLDSEQGRALLRSLIERADFLIESADAQQRSARGNTPAQTLAINPALIHVSISAFGSDGPKADYAATDLTLWAAGGPLLPSRDGARPPLRMSAPQSWLNAAADAAGGALIAHFARLQSGRGQHVDVSAQQSAALCTLAVSLAAPVGHPDFAIPGSAAAEKNEEKEKKKKKELDLSGSGSRTRRSKWQVKDGLVEMHIGIGPAGGRFANNLFKWLASENACDADIASWDFIALPQRLLSDEITEEDMERARTNVADFFARFTKEELLEKAMEKRFLCAPIATTQDLLDSRQLHARNYFETVTEASGAKRTLPGPFAAGAPAAFARLTPAPSPGQHSADIVRDWLALDDAGIDSLRTEGALA